MCQAHQAGKLTLEFQHIKNLLVHPQKNLMGNDVMAYVSRGEITHTPFYPDSLVIHASLYLWGGKATL